MLNKTMLEMVTCGEQSKARFKVVTSEALTSFLNIWMNRYSTVGSNIT